MAFKFRHKLLLAFVATTLFALAIFLVVNLVRLREVARDRTHQGLESAEGAFLESQRQLGDGFSEAVKTLVSSTPDLQAVLAGRAGSGQDPFAHGAGSGDAEDRNTLESTVPFTPLYERSNQFLVVDTSRNVLLAKRPDVPLPAGDAALEEALQGRRGYAWWPLPGGGTLQVFSSPVVTPSGVVGAILVGTPVDKAFLAPLEKISLTTIEIAPRQDAYEDQIFEVRRGESRYLAGFAKVTSPSGSVVGRFLVLRSLAAELTDANKQANRLILLAALCLLFSAGMALYLSRLVSRPLEALGHAVREVGAGNFRFRLASAARDEFGQLGNLIDEMAAGLEERERIRATFGQYVDSEVVGEVLKNEGADALAGQEKEISVLFSDLANFTSFSEGKNPRDLLRDLNAYFDSMAGSVKEHGGTLDKFIGDAIMAYWGAPAANPAHPELACTAALDMIRRFRLELLPAYPALGLRIGIASGPALVGSVGSERRRNYTVMGDTVNLASRLEGVNKAFGTAICLSEGTRRALGSRFACRYLGLVKVAGRQEAEKVYELLSTKPLEGRAADTVRAYEEAAALFEAGDLPSVCALVRPYAEAGDGPSLALLKRSTDKRKHDRRDGPWDGVWVLSK